VGSFAFQGALRVGILTYARPLRLRKDPLRQAAKGCLILRGNGFVLCTIVITLMAESVAVILHPVAPSGWGGILLAELVGMILRVAICAIVRLRFRRRVKTAPPPRDVTPADAMADLWTLVRVSVQTIRRLLPRGLVDWIERFQSDQVFAKASWIAPRLHPWRFAAAIGLLAGLGLVLAQLREGLPPSLAVGLLVTGIFFIGELFAALIGFAVFGGFLGIQPSLRNRYL
jgi:hypothetical protein